MALLALLLLQVSLAGAAGPELLVTVGDVTDTDAVRWVREHALGGVENFGEVGYADLYPGVDLRWYGTQSKVEYDLTVQPNAAIAHVTSAKTSSLSTKPVIAPPLPE